MKYFQGYVAWRSAFFSLMEIEQPEEIPMHVAEHCLADGHYYASKKEDVAATGVDMDAREGVSPKRKAAKNKQKAAGAAEPSKN